MHHSWRVAETTLADLGMTDHGGLLPIEQGATHRDLISARSGIYHAASNAGDNSADAPDRGSQEPGTYFLYNNWDFNAAGGAFELQTGIDIYDALRDDLQISTLNGFGFPADPDLLGEKLGGHAHMIGGPSPVVLKEGPHEEIVAACAAYIRAVGKRGGYTLMTGGGDLPGTPLEHYPAMMEASRQVGCPI